jgi:hypothetical protein
MSQSVCRLAFLFTQIETLICYHIQVHWPGKSLCHYIYLRASALAMLKLFTSLKCLNQHRLTG